MNPVYLLMCPKCGAGAGLRCKALRTGRTTDVHRARWDALESKRKQMRRAER